MEIAQTRVVLRCPEEEKCSFAYFVNLPQTGTLADTWVRDIDDMVRKLIARNLIDEAQGRLIAENASSKRDILYLEENACNDIRKIRRGKGIRGQIVKGSFINGSRAE